jgi:hypothetical protein
MSEFDDNLLSGGDWEDEGFSVNFSEKEASSEARAYKALPKGEYLCNITDVSLEESKSEANYGKPMFNFELTVADGEYKDRRMFNRAMLWEGALYTISQYLKACGIDPKAGKIPPASWWLGKQVVAVVAVVQKMDKDESTGKYTVRVYDDPETKKIPTTQNDVKGVKPASSYIPGSAGTQTTTPPKKSGVDALLS